MELLYCLAGVLLLSSDVYAQVNANVSLLADYPLLHSNCPKIDDPAHSVMLMYPNDCRKYYICAGGLAYPQNCPDTLFWSQITNSCNRPELANCGPIVQPTPTTPNRPECLAISYMPHLGDCNRFVEMCERRCQPNYQWNVRLQRCDLPNNVNCEHQPFSPTGATPILPTSDMGFPNSNNLDSMCKAANQIYIPYPGDCTKFVQCDYKPFVKSCPPFLFWNSKLLTCDKLCI